jgi:indole-3-glycerol phosphate synthase
MGTGEIGLTDFLDLMAAVSHARVDALRAREPMLRLRSRASATGLPVKFQRRGKFDVIAEFKRGSPSAGSFGEPDLTERVTAYARAGAAAISVLTESTQFRGELSHLTTAAEAAGPLGVPVMRKDFIVDPYQVYETRAALGGGILLIVRMLSRDQLGELIGCAREMSLFVLLEVFDEDDLARADYEIARWKIAVERTPILLGVNCRDLRTLAVRPQRFLELAPRLPSSAIRVAESGIETAADCARVARAGFDLALVGGALMRSSDPAALIDQMLAEGRSE